VLEFILSIFAAMRVFLCSRSDTALEVLTLRQQVAVLKRKRPRPPLNALDRFFWTTLQRLWPRWSEVLVIVKPETVIGWHCAGFRLYWRWRSRPRGGRPKITEEIRGLIRQMAEENAGWGAPKIHGELQKLGFEVSERTVARYLRRTRRGGDPGKSWLAFLENHREVIVAFDFFTVPTVTFKLLYGFFIIEHGRRRILHFNVTRHPTAEWVVQQLREAFPEAGPYQYAIFDRDSKFDGEVITFLKATGLKPRQTDVQAPWQNGIAERWVGSCRREMLDHVIALNEQHLRRLVREFVSYYHQDRVHDSLEKDAPNRRPIERKPSRQAMVISSPHLGGLHHRYSWRQPASFEIRCSLVHQVWTAATTTNGRYLTFRCVQFRTGLPEAEFVESREKHPVRYDAAPRK
jgi:putative transposase